MNKYLVEVYDSILLVSRLYLIEADTESEAKDYFTTITSKVVKVEQLI